MGALGTILGIALGVGLLVVLGYWQLVIAEGAYLGQPVVTWLYDLAAHRYDSIKGFDDDLEALFLGRPLANALADRSAPLVLDIGTGTARLPLTLLGQPSFQGRIVGLDDSRGMLAIAAVKAQQHLGQLWLIWQNAARLPFPNGVFDAVTCLEMLEFTPHPERVLSEAVRVLKPDGVFVTTRRRGFDAWLMPGKTYRSSTFQRLLEELGLLEIRIQPWQVDYDLLWAQQAGEPTSASGHLFEVLQCPRCWEFDLSDQADHLACGNCGARVPVRDGVIEYRAPSQA